jgi:hypothetical protein
MRAVLWWVGLPDGMILEFGITSKIIVVDSNFITKYDVNFEINDSSEIWMLEKKTFDNWTPIQISCYAQNLLMFDKSRPVC